MKRLETIWCVLAILLVFPVLSEAETPAQPASSPFSLTLTPDFTVPLGSDAALFAVGGGGTLSGEYRMPFLPLLFAGAGFGYSYVPLKSVTTLSLLDGSITAGVRYDILRNLSVRAYANGGYYYAFLNNGSQQKAANPFAGGGVGLSWSFVPSLSLGLGAAYRNFFGLYNDLSVSLGVSYTFPVAGPASERRPQPARPGLLNADQVDNPGIEGQGLVMRDLAFGHVFPIFHAWYDSNPIGSLTLINTGSAPATVITVSLNIRQYMDAPKQSATIPEMKPGEKKVIDLLALFKSSILEITQTTKLAAEVTVNFTQDGETRRLGKVETVDVYDRNAMTWDDTRKAAAFVTPKEPVVLFFSNNVNAILRDKMNRAIDRNIQTAIAFHDALRQYGISYVSPPLTSYAVVSENKQAVDSLKFPRETISYRSGDCSDLSILYSALLESVQIETAFITIPGHIFMAFALDASEDEARTTFSQTDELIFTEGKVWVPVEVTEREGSFMTAWQEGAKEWRENVLKKQAEFWPVRDAWKTYEAVFFPGTGSQPELPKAAKVLSDFQDDVSRLVTREMFDREAALKAAVAKSGGSAKSVNALGVLYARFDQQDKAEAQFQKILAKSEFVPTLVNMGNLSYLRGDFKKALTYYNRAYKQAPTDATVVLAVARANQELQNYGTVKETFDALKKLDPALASRFAYLDLQGEQSTRAAEVSRVKNVVVWEEVK